uniref:Hypothetical secreted protein n=1 Tax=Glossina morsitans morsitans TaxID=37546 RepID=D3TM30_GLOMM
MGDSTRVFCFLCSFMSLGWRICLAFLWFCHLADSLQMSSRENLGGFEPENPSVHTFFLGQTRRQNNRQSGEPPNPSRPQY